MLAEIAMMTALATGPDKTAGECSNYAYVGTGVSLCTKLPTATEALCAQVGAPVKVVGKDVWGLDRDDDGTGCESVEGPKPSTSSSSPAPQPTKTSSSPAPSKSSSSAPAAASNDDEPQLPLTGPTAWALGGGGGAALLIGAGVAYAARRRRVNFTA